MRHMRWTVVLAIGLASCAVMAEPISSAGRIDAVTVYRGQALVTRMVDVPGEVGLREVIVTDLPEHIVASSLYAESADGVEVRSTRYRVRPISHDVREEVSELDRQIRELQDQLKANEAQTKRLAENRAYLEKLEQFVAPTANAEMTRGVLNAETLEKLTTFLFENRKTLTGEELELGLQARELKEQMELLQRKRGEVTGSSSRTAREAVVFLNKTNADAGALRIRYLVGDATWSPSYNVRANGERTNVLVEYNASIQQRSGEDWNDVAMTLSTATPSLIAKAPSLTPMTISLALPQQTTQPIAKGADVKQLEQQLRRQIAATNDNRGVSNLSFLPQAQQDIAQVLIDSGSNTLNANGFVFGNTVFDEELNRLAGQLQNLDLVNPLDVRRKKAAARANEVVSVTYELSGRTTLPSRSDQQLIQIAAVDMAADFYKLAVPVLTNQVYEEASIVNAGDRVLLAGPVMAYMGGKFVGHCEIPTVSVGERFAVGFGIDSTLRTARELVTRDESIQGGNRVVNFTYRLDVENFDDEPAAVRLLDRLPQTKNGDVKLTPGSTGQDLSTDASYLQTDHKNGILRWEVEVLPKSIGPDAWSLEYKFTLEYDKKMNISGMAVTMR